MPLNSHTYTDNAILNPVAFSFSFSKTPPHSDCMLLQAPHHHFSTSYCLSPSVFLSSLFLCACSTAHLDPWFRSESKCQGLPSRENTAQSQTKGEKKRQTQSRAGNSFLCPVVQFRDTDLKLSCLYLILIPTALFHISKRV